MNTQTLLTDLTPQEEENVQGGKLFPIKRFFLWDGWWYRNPNNVPIHYT